MPSNKPPDSKPNRAPDPSSSSIRPSAADPSRKPPPQADSGRITHDSRGNAVWRWAAAVGAQVLESTSRLLKRLEVPELKVDDKPKGLELEERNPGGGYDPYNTGKGSGRGR